MIRLMKNNGSGCYTEQCQGQNYLFPPSGNQFIPNNYQRNGYLNNQQQFRQERPDFQQIDSYLPQRDLHTSDLPIHLQQTLPQYQFTSTRNPNYRLSPDPVPTKYFFEAGDPSSYRSLNILPTTHRPNYSHLFSQTHVKDPSQTETFLGEITLQNPEEPPPQFNNFNPAIFPQNHQHAYNQNNNNVKNDRINKEYYSRSKLGENTVQLNNNPSKFDFSNQRTRVIAPSDNKGGKATIKNYFINTQGDVYTPTRVPQSPKTTQTTTRDENEFLPQNLAYAAPNNSFDLESLLEEPINISRAHSQSDDVEIIKSVGKPIPNDSEATPTPQDQLHEGSEEAEAVTEDYDYDTTYASHTSTSHEENDVQHEDYPDHDDENDKKIKSGYDILINTPMKLVRDDNFKQFIDTTVIDNSTDESLSLKSEEPVSTLTTASSLDVDNNTEISHDLESSNERDYVYDEDESENISSPLKDYTSKEKKQNYEEEPKLVVSVVTTKSVVNNTIIASATPTPPPFTTHKMTPPSIVDNTTDSWVVVASVQTSRSISGARYLPSHNVKQDERVKMLNEDLDQEDILEETTEETLTEEVTTISPTTTSSRPKTSTESLIDKLDRVQSDLSSGLLVGGFKNEGNNIAVITENMTDKMDVTTMLNKTPPSNPNASPPVVIRKFSANARPPAVKRPKKIPPPSFKPRNPTKSPAVDINIPQGDEPTKNISLSPPPRKGVSVNKVQVQDISAFLPPGYKLGKEEKEDTNTDLLKDILSKIKPKAENKTADDILSKAKKVDISAFLPPGYKPKPEGINKDQTKPTQQTKTIDKPNKTTSSILPKVKPVSDISHLLPPGYKPPANAGNETKPSIESILAKAKPIDDISALLPPGFKPKYAQTTAKPKAIEGLLKDAKTVDISALLPPGYKLRTSTESPRSTTLETVTAPSNLLPPGYNARSSENESSKPEPSSSSTSTTTTSKPGGFKVVFPSRPGGAARKSSHRLTTPKVIFDDEPVAKPVTVPTIHKGWPSRATTEFTGWPSPSTTPISIERLLEAARASSTTPETSRTFSTSTQAPTTTTTTTTQRPTTPGVCEDGCDLASTIKLVAGVQWVPELLDRNTKEWQILANEVQTQLEEVYSRSNLLNKWYKTIRIDGFAEGSVLVDYVVELNDMGRKINTLEIKRLFHESLDDALTMYGNREGKALNETLKLEGKLGLGNFLVDPTYTDFIVLPKQTLPPVAMEENVLLPQWAIAVIVIGLASLLFVIIFGVTVLVNRQKNAKKKAPTPLTEDMLNELNKNHMGGFDNYGADDLYNMEDVWNERGGYEAKIPKKRSAGSIHDNSMSNLYDSWRSEWNGYYYNAYYGNHAGSSHSGYARRRSDYDTNF